MKSVSFDVVVVGGGIRGCAIIYYLARAGARVCLIERKGIAAGASSANTAHLAASTKQPAPYTALSMESVRLYRDLEAELDCQFDYEPNGLIGRIIFDERLRPELEWFAEQQNKVPGMHVAVLTRHELRELEPALSEEVVAGTYCASDGALDSLKLIQGYARAAQRFGAKIFTGTEVIGVEMDGDRVVGVTTNAGRLATETIVNATGIDCPTIGRMVGVEIPVVSCHGQVLATQRLPRMIHRPVGNVRQMLTGEVLIGTTNDFDERSLRITPEGMAGNARGAMRDFPFLRGATITRAWAGLRPWTIDTFPILGWAPDVRGFAIATGHSGIILAPITGILIAELLTSGQTHMPLDNWNLLRFQNDRYHFPLYAYRRWIQT